METAIQQYLNDLTGWQLLVASAIVLAGSIAIGIALNEIAFVILSRFIRHHGVLLKPELIAHWRGPGRLLVPLIFGMLTIPSLPLPEIFTGILRRLFGLTFIVGAAWMAMRTFRVFRDAMLMRYGIAAIDDATLAGRKIYTQLKVVEKVFAVVVIIATAAWVLMSFDAVRQIGISVLASAGIIGVILGFAAQKSISTLFAGVQIAITQPIRINDVVIVEGDWGRIEEINLTYAVIKTWDLRRRVVPVTYFLEQSFQNWTRSSEDLLGTVMIYCDYTVAVNDVREELYRLLEANPKWDRKVGQLQVTEANDHVIELRALLSAKDAGTLFGLRCEIREQLLEFVRTRYPHALPRNRIEVAGGKYPP